MDKAYDHTKEEQIYELWEKQNSFQPVHAEKSFTIIMPPPNANDPLHVGHAMFIAIEDILIRYHRMKGEATEWLPGTDHAGIETQFVYEKKLAKEDKSRFDFDRQTLYQQIWDYVQVNSGLAISQMKRLGASADWARYKFTLNPEVVSFVSETFVKLHADKLVYRAEKLVNYCPHCGTAYSELEVDHEERTDKLYFIDYPFTDGNGTITVATTRPETLFGDVAVAVNPQDPRYKEYIGRKVKLSLTTREIEIIADDGVDQAFGTGAVKITPAHDPFDWSVIEKNKEKFNLLEEVTNHTVVGMNGKMTTNAGPGYEGLSVFKAREKVVAELQLDERAKVHTHNVGICYRCKRVIEPLPLPQFFVKVAPLTKPVLEALDKKDVVVHGTGREAILRTWLTNLKDWNVSRQIVWGIRMPVWYDIKKNPSLHIVFINENKEVIKGILSELSQKYSLSQIKDGLQILTAPTDAEFIVSTENPGEDFLQETDTFDTWFSSGQWPVVTLKTGQKGDFEKFYPTSVMETAYEILPFWVMRMLMLGIYLTGKVPFHDVYLHGLVRDGQGRKMSKSVGNVVNPIEFVEKYGADALRMALVMGSTPGQDKSVGEPTIKGMRNLSNKIWNATRFVKDFTGEAPENNDFKKWLGTVTEQATKYLDMLRPGQAAEQIYNEFWHGFCDLWIEEAKKGSLGRKQLEEGIIVFLKLLHPFMPFVTESSYQALRQGNETDILITSPWPIA